MPGYLCLTLTILKLYLSLCLDFSLCIYCLSLAIQNALGGVKSKPSTYIIFCLSLLFSLFVCLFVSFVLSFFPSPYFFLCLFLFFRAFFLFILISFFCSFLLLSFFLFSFVISFSFCSFYLFYFLSEWHNTCCNHRFLLE